MSETSYLRYLCPYFLVTLFLCQLRVCLSAPSTQMSNKLLIILVDGLRWDYINDKDLLYPGFHTLLTNGVKAEHLEPVFPTLCYPNIYSLATGVYPEDHGVVGNYMFDGAENQLFRPKSPNSFWWDKGEPIWITANKQGKRSAWYYWPGCEVTIYGRRADYCTPYFYYPRKSHVKNAIIDAIDKLENGTVDIAGVYSEVLDVYGHRYPRGSPEMQAALKDVDDVVKETIVEIYKRRLQHGVNVMVVSDHGITPISTDRVVSLVNVIKDTDVLRVLDGGSYANIWPSEGKFKQVYTLLKHSNQPITVYKRQDLPDRWRYKKSNRVAPITVLADPGWFIISHHKGFPMYTDKKIPGVGTHGYDNNVPDMWGTFIAMGPDFNRGVRGGKLSVVDVYQLMCHCLDIKPSNNNGSWQAVSPLVTQQSKSSRRIANVKYNVINQSNQSNQSHLLFIFTTFIAMTRSLLRF